MKICHIHNVPPDDSIIWVFSKESLQSLRGRNNLKVAFVGNHIEDEQVLLSLLKNISILYINPKYVKNPYLKNLILRLNPEILL